MSIDLNAKTLFEIQEEIKALIRKKAASTTAAFVSTDEEIQQETMNTTESVLLNWMIDT